MNNRSGVREGLEKRTIAPIYYDMMNNSLGEKLQNTGIESLKVLDVAAIAGGYYC
jgi:hypothetical protein